MPNEAIINQIRHLKREGKEFALEFSSGRVVQVWDQHSVTTTRQIHAPFAAFRFLSARLPYDVNRSLRGTFMIFFGQAYSYTRSEVIVNAVTAK
jgi:hypothetical protein